jgi:hypothetical protein
MRKSLKRVLDRLRTVTNGRFRKPTAVREDLQVPQRMEALGPSTRTRPAR